MKKISTEIKVFLSLGFLLIAVAAFFQIPAYEGFNPSDDGVILAQSYRILHGQMPHDDFISIRPAGSALFHTIAFLIPGPFEWNARWIVYLQYLIYSFVWAWLFYQRLPSGCRRISLLVFLSVVIFVLNQNHYNLYPWTTIDALFFFSLGFLFFSQKKYIPALLLAGMASLCRQTFALPFLLMLLTVMRSLWMHKQFARLYKVLLFSSIPFLLYAGLLISHGALGDFISQMTGRTELWETGFVKYWKVFWNSPLAFVFVLMMLLILFQRLAAGKESIWKKNPTLEKAGWLVAGLVGLILSLLVFVDPSRLFLYSFQVFYLLLILMIFQREADNSGEEFEHHSWLNYWVLLVAWTSSVSLGDNSPVFSTGIIVGGILFILAQKDVLPKQSVIHYLAGAFLVALFVYGQRNNNYRDLPARELKFKAGEAFEGLGPVRTNERTGAYLSEVKRVYRELKEPVGRFVIIPNGALFYPLLGSPNPMPLDWMQGAEFVGQERELIERMNKAPGAEPLYFLIDRIDSKRMSDTLIPSSYPAGDYPYMKLLMDSTRAIHSISSKWFEVRQWQ